MKCSPQACRDHQVNRGELMHGRLEAGQQRLEAGQRTSMLASFPRSLQGRGDEK
jgi:hypothetical protein